MFSIIKTIYNSSSKKAKNINKIKDKRKLYKSFFMNNSNTLNPVGRKILIDLMEETKLFCNIQDDKELITREKNRYLLYYILSILYDDYTEIYKELINEVNYE